MRSKSDYARPELVTILCNTKNPLTNINPQWLVRGFLFYQEPPNPPMSFDQTGLPRPELVMITRNPLTNIKPQWLVRGFLFYQEPPNPPMRQEVGKGGAVDQSDYARPELVYVCNTRNPLTNIKPQWLVRGFLFYQEPPNPQMSFDQTGLPRPELVMITRNPLTNIKPQWLSTMILDNTSMNIYKGLIVVYVLNINGKDILVLKGKDNVIHNGRTLGQKSGQEDIKLLPLTIMNTHITFTPHFDVC
uniref:Uncharacterized protein n=1 Tax=Branchiostoma floridae TaxID=7739 RepID=C3XSW6_BRAFL|eukprot:XP_002612825.1 hypothetical protein BRAFLDRAFT_67227 [Branchiostoma floridae]